MVSRLMAPWWRDYMAATASNSRSGKNVSPKEVQLYIQPHADTLKNDSNYREQVTKLLNTRSSASHATPRAVAPLRALLASTGPQHVFQARVIGTPRYSPGMGIVPFDPPPDMVIGPHVHLTVLFGEGTAKPVARTTMDNRKRTVTINGVKVKVDGTLTVYVRGESDRLTRIRSLPKEIDVPAPFLSSPFGDGGPRYALVVKDDRDGHAHRQLSISMFQPGPAPL